jgi:hypothetical protein
MELNRINNLAERGMQKFSGTKVIERAVNYLSKDNNIDAGKFGKVLVVTNAAKDLINCGFYVYQSYNNKRIPEEKRKFVAALDLANGMFMVVTQLFLGLTICNENVQKALNNKLFGKLEKSAAEFAKKIHPEITVREAENFGKKVFKNCGDGFKVASGLIVATILAKRLIVPFIATPTASWFKKKYMDTPKPATQDELVLHNKYQDAIKQEMDS